MIVLGRFRYLNPSACSWFLPTTRPLLNVVFACPFCTSSRETQVFLHMADVVAVVWPEKSLAPDLTASEVGDAMLWLDGAASH
jgi:hypothetical protein